MKSEVFDLSKFNIIEDENNYYVFRALNNSDHKDIESGKTSTNGTIDRIRTDRERFDEQNSRNAKYNANSKISLEEVWDHIKIRYLKETNCISLSSNANVLIDYGQVYNQEYVMITIPKQKEQEVYNAGLYMLQEIEKEIDNVISDKSIENSEVISLIKRIDEIGISGNVRTIVGEAYERVRKTSGTYKGSNNKLKSKSSIISRFEKKQYFSDEQQLEYDKIIAKLTVLEVYGYLRSILPTKADNSSLIATVGMAFSSEELIHYGDIKKEQITRSNT